MRNNIEVMEHNFVGELETVSEQTSEQSGRTEFVDVAGGRIAYDVAGAGSQGPLIVLSPGMADTRSTYRFLVPPLVEAGYRVASVDLRGHGESSTGWESYNHADTAGDLVAVIEKLGGPAVLVGQSFSGAAVTIAAATRPDLVSGLVEIDPFTRPLTFSVGAFLRNSHNYRRGAIALMRFALTGNVKAWAGYLDIAYPGRKPADWDSWLAALLTNLRDGGRVAAVRKMMTASATQKQAAAQLADVHCPVLIVMGSDDSDFADPEAEAAGIVGQLPAGVGEYTMIERAGHYPHAEFPEQVSAAVLRFLAGRVHA